MSITPKITLVAYETRDPRKVFVKVPNQRGRWMLVDRCVVEVPCPFCKTAAGEPCISKTTKGSHDYMIDAHYHRRRAFMFSRKTWKITALPHDELTRKPRYRVIATIGAPA